MIHFKDLDLICRVDGHIYKVVYDGKVYPFGSCENCSLAYVPLCKILPCYDSQSEIHFHYEDITKEIMATIRRLCHEG